MSSSGLPFPFTSIIEARPDPPVCAGGPAAKRPAQQVAESAAARRGLRRTARRTLFRHVAGDHHVQDRLHLLEQSGVESCLGGGVRRDGTAHVLGAEDQPEDFVGAIHVRGMRGDDVIEQPAAPEPA